MLKLSVISAAVVVYAMKASMEVAGHQISTFSTIEPFPSQACDFSSEHGGADIVVFGDSLSDYHNNWLQDGTPQSPPWDQHYSNGPVWPQHVREILGLEEIYAAPTNGTGPNGTDWRGNNTFTWEAYTTNKSGVFDYAYGGATSSSGGDGTPRFLFGPDASTPDVPGAFQQVEQYVSDLKAAGDRSTHDPAASVHLFWVGMNDFWRLIPIVVKKEFLLPLAGGANLITFPEVMADVASKAVEKLVMEGGARTVIVPLFFGADQIPQGELISGGNPTILGAARAIMASASAAVNASMVRLSETLPVAAQIHTVDVRALYGNKTTLTENYGITNFDDPCVEKSNVTGKWSFTKDAAFCNVSFSMEGVHPTAPMTKFLGDAYSSIICKAKGLSSSPSLSSFQDRNLMV